MVVQINVHMRDNKLYIDCADQTQPTTEPVKSAPDNITGSDSVEAAAEQAKLIQKEKTEEAVKRKELEEAAANKGKLIIANESIPIHPSSNPLAHARWCPMLAFLAASTVLSPVPSC